MQHCLLKGSAGIQRVVISTQKEHVARAQACASHPSKRAEPCACCCRRAIIYLAETCWGGRCRLPAHHPHVLWQCNTPVPVLPPVPAGSCGHRCDWGGAVHPASLLERPSCILRVCTLFTHRHDAVEPESPPGTQCVRVLSTCQALQCHNCYGSS